MRQITSLATWIVITQLLVMALFRFAQYETIAIHAIYSYSSTYFIFLLVGLMVALWAAWTLLMRAMTLRGVGDKAGRAAKTKGFRV